MDMFPTTGRVDMFPSTYDINPINSTHVETVVLLEKKTIVSVSYTHLDVYKRQSFASSICVLARIKLCLGLVTLK